MNQPVQVLLFLLALLMLVGCDESIGTRQLPAPLRAEAEYELVGRAQRIWGGDHFDFGDSNVLHYVIIRGVDSPKSGQRFYTEAKRATTKLVRGKDVRIKVVDRNEQMIEIGDVFVINPDPADIQGDVNVGLELLRQGMGWYNGAEFPDSDLYKQAAAEAKAIKIGLWSEPNPIPPWEFESANEK